MPQVNYNEISKIYDDVREGDLVLIKHFLQELPVEPPLNILDIGCGTGNYTNLFQKVTETRQYRFYGIDPSAGMIRKAREKNPRILFHQASAEILPFRNDFFDFVFMTDVIHHIPDIRRMFAEIHRVLRSAGKVCIVTQSHRQIENRPIAQIFPGTIAIDKNRYPDIDEIVSAAHQADLLFHKQEILFAGAPIELRADFLELVRKKGYSMLHLLSDQEYQKGLEMLENALANGPIPARMAGETLVWFAKG